MWDDKFKVLKMIDSKKGLRFKYLIASFILLAYTALTVVGQFLLSEALLETKLLAFEFAALFLVLGAMRLMHMRKSTAQEILAHYNSLIQYERRYMGKGKVDLFSKSKIQKNCFQKILILNTKVASRESPLFIIDAYLISMTGLSLIVPLTVGVFGILDPCTPPLLGWWVLDCETETSGAASTHFSIKLLTISSLTFSALFSGSSGAVGGSVYGVFLKVVSILSSLKDLRNVPEFLSDRDLFELMRQKLHMYRQLQLLVKCFNGIYCWMFLGVFMFLFQLLVSISLYCFIRFNSKISLPGSVYLGTLAVEGLIAIIIFYTVCGKVHFTSTKISKDWNRIAVVRRSAWFRKSYASCPGMKITVGSFSFINKLTPFVVSSLCIKLTVRLLMIS